MVFQSCCKVGVGAPVLRALRGARIMVVITVTFHMPKPTHMPVHRCAVGGGRLWQEGEVQGAGPVLVQRWRAPRLPIPSCFDTDSCHLSVDGATAALWRLLEHAGKEARSPCPVTLVRA